MDGVIPATSISGDKGKAVCGVLTKRGEGTSHVPLLVANTLKVYRPNVWVILFLNKGHRRKASGMNEMLFFYDLMCSKVKLFLLSFISRFVEWCLRIGRI